MLRLNIVGNIMAIVLYQRGLLALHASVVEINHGAIAFLGVSGRGKSTTAAAFHAKGYTITNDDVAPVTLSQKPPTITPGFPQFKMCRKIADYLGYDYESLNFLCPGLNKRGYRQTQDISQIPLPIHHLYVLADDIELGIELIPPQQAVIELSRYAHPETLYYSKDPAHFLQCAALAQTCKIYRLKRPRDLSSLPKLVELVEQHLSHNLAAIPA